MKRLTRPLPASFDGFDAVIDVRSPAEFAADHIPGAVNFPVLSDAQRIQIGTLHKQVSAFAARKCGSALVAANIAAHLQSPYFAGLGYKWKPLVYCWRGGKRSAAMTHVLREIGWDAVQLDGGYKSFRHAVIAELDALAGALSYRVVCGETGSGKSRLLRALAAAGAQVLDLENLACHRGSLLGNFPHQKQPTQKAFDTALWHALTQFVKRRPVFVEAESKKIGDLRVPDSLIHGMWASPCIRLILPHAERIALLQVEYAHFFADPGDLCAKLDGLAALHGKQVIESWKALAISGAWSELIAALLTRHYDPAYRRSTARNYPQLDQAIPVSPRDAGTAAMTQAAGDILRLVEPAEIPA